MARIHGAQFGMKTFFFFDLHYRILRKTLSVPPNTFTAPPTPSHSTLAPGLMHCVIY